MKKSLKRTVSLFLCLAMVFCVPAFAAEEDVLDEHDGHDCAEHEHLLDAGVPSFEVLPYDVGIDATALTCTSHSFALVDSGEYRKEAIVKVMLPDKTIWDCYEIRYYLAWQWVCQKCGYADRTDVLVGESHTVVH